MPTSTPDKYIKKFEKNLTGQDFVAGDIHGHFEILATLLSKVGFNKKTDRVFCTGDLIDRGPYSEQVVEWLKKPWFHSVRGNHEHMILEGMCGRGDSARHMKNGGMWFYKLPHRKQKQIFNSLIDLPFAIEISIENSKRIAIIHAEPPFWEDNRGWSEALSSLYDTRDVATQKKAIEYSLYSRNKLNLKDRSTINGIDTIYVGHSTVKKPLKLGNTLYIDTGCSFSDGALSIVNLKTGEISTL